MKVNKDRHVGQISFNLRDCYEKELFNHAYKAEHGEFSKYIKRLIDRDRESDKVISTSNNHPTTPNNSEEDVIAAEGFL